ncbi:MAG: membrane integrity-associated transporter subunit PqiC [Burkholderiales bacterium]|nr:membrane integrity-associated transporter subunit PqiC [Burkholderiales bacterium]
MKRLLLAIVALLGACATSPPSRYYTLSGPPAPAASVTAGPSVMVGPVAIPAAIDRPEFVITVGENEVWLDEFNRWAAPLSDAIGLAVVENLGATLASPRVTLLAQSSDGQADYRAAIEVQRFESVPGSHALLDAVYTVRRTSDGRAVTGRTTGREAVADKSYDTLAAAHSRLVARLSRDVAQAVRSLAAAPAR